ncbi:MAG: nicotinate-nucleotide adenylyltransferase [Chloroflexota bacterium]|nr:nicotinate-nucleotide adenylyltransferase [Chloroflexota bacterium]
MTGAATPVRAGSVGIMGGTFDPVHIGHLAAAEEARNALGLGSILFVPAGIPPHKRARGITEAAHRVAMLELAIAGNEAFELSRVELDRPGPSYTLDTVEQLAAESRRAGGEADLTVILSAESFRGLPTWHQPERLLALARIAVVPRGGFPPPGRAWLEQHFPGCEARVSFLDAPHLRLSATEIRDRVAARRSIRYLVPDAVIAYIEDHGLYQITGGRTAT